MVLGGRNHANATQVKYESFLVLETKEVMSAFHVLSAFKKAELLQIPVQAGGKDGKSRVALSLVCPVTPRCTLRSGYLMGTQGAVTRARSSRQKAAHVKTTVHQQSLAGKHVRSKPTGRDGHSPPAGLNTRKPSAACASCILLLTRYPHVSTSITL